MPKFEVTLLSARRVYEEIHLLVEADDEAAAREQALNDVEDPEVAGDDDWEEYDAGEREDTHVYNVAKYAEEGGEADEGEQADG